MDLSNVNLKGIDLIDYLAYTMGDRNLHNQYRSLILDELEKQNVNIDSFDVKELRQFSLRILYRALIQAS